jgi:predicted NUDIX family NTP pyrophosphohydrolase
VKKLSAGILVYNITSDDGPIVLLVHPGGPFWKNKDEGAWSIPKGEYGEGEDPLSAAKREFTEETGCKLPDGDFIPLRPVKMQSGKVISAWALQATLNLAHFTSNQFEIEWPPGSGRKQFFPEVDKAEWFALPVAKSKINKNQINFIEQLEIFLDSFNL